ncbi:MAG: hypothetical protein H6682_16870 [Candidatus Eisenbacteria bacterium]|nr:hypothetical protein [Candidatus Eisenbacteria bacterium]
MKWTIVFCGKRGALYKARCLLEQQGIRCRATRPRRDEGHLRVAGDVAERARSLLASLADGRVVSASEAACFLCPACGATLSGGEMYCPDCQTCIGDPHGK